MRGGLAPLRHWGDYEPKGVSRGVAITSGSGALVGPGWGFGQNGPPRGGPPRDPPGTKFCTFRRVFNKSPIRDKHGTPIFSVFLHFWDKIAIGTNMVWVGTNIMALYIAIWGVYTVPPTPPIFCIYLCTYLAQKRSFWGYPGGSIGTPRETPE